MDHKFKENLSESGLIFCKQRWLESYFTEIVKVTKWRVDDRNTQFFNMMPYDF